MAEFKSKGQPTNWYTSVTNIELDNYAYFNKDGKV
jgi:hypothetical protein